MDKIPVIEINYMAASDDFSILLIADKAEEITQTCETYMELAGYDKNRLFYNAVVTTKPDLYDAFTLRDYSANLNMFKTDDEVRNAYENTTDASCYLIDGFAPAVIGISQYGRLIYDFDKIIEILMTRDHISAEEALDFYSYNIERSFGYMQPSPIILSH